MKKMTNATKGMIIMVMIALIAGFGGYHANSIISAKAAEEVQEPEKISWEQMAATEVFEDEMLNDLEESWSELREGGFTSYSYDIVETEVNGIYKCQVDMIYRDNETVSVVMIYDVYEDDGYVYMLIDGEHVSSDVCESRYDW